MNEVQQRIYLLLRDNAVGRSSAIKASNIAIRLGIPSEGSNSQNIRNEIKLLRIDSNILIGSSNQGYFMIVDQEDLNVTIRHLESRVSETNRLIECLQRNFQDQENG